MQENAEGDEYVSLSKTRRVTVRDFKGKTYVDLRDVSVVASNGGFWFLLLSSSPLLLHQLRQGSAVNCASPPSSNPTHALEQLFPRFQDGAAPHFTA